MLMTETCWGYKVKALKYTRVSWERLNESLAPLFNARNNNKLSLSRLVSFCGRVTSALYMAAGSMDCYFPGERTTVYQQRCGLPERHVTKAVSSLVGGLPTSLPMQSASCESAVWGWIWWNKGSFIGFISSQSCRNSTKRACSVRKSTSVRPRKQVQHARWVPFRQGGAGIKPMRKLIFVYSHVSQKLVKPITMWLYRATDGRRAHERNKLQFAQTSPN